MDDPWSVAVAARLVGADVGVRLACSGTSGGAADILTAGFAIMCVACSGRGINFELMAVVAGAAVPICQFDAVLLASGLATMCVARGGGIKFDLTAVVAAGFAVVRFARACPAGRAADSGGVLASSLGGAPGPTIDIFLVLARFAFDLVGRSAVLAGRYCLGPRWQTPELQLADSGQPRAFGLYGCG